MGTGVGPMAFDIEAFTLGFIATLIDRDISAIQPLSPEDRRGFHMVVQMLDQEVQQMRGQGDCDQDWYREIVRLRNGLKPSNSGAFDNFETALRDLQLSVTSAPNVFYEYITFSVSKPYAQSIIGDMPQTQQDIILKAANAFLSSRKEVGPNESRSSSEIGEQVVSA